MKNWNDFLIEFVLRAMTNAQIIEQYTIKQMISLARESWDAIQAAELPESEKAKQTPAPSFVSTAGLAPIAANSPDLKELARQAREVGDEMQWIAIDASGQVWAYDLKPDVYEPEEFWYNDAFAWEITQVAPPADFRTELYEISKLLENDNN